MNGLQRYTPLSLLVCVSVSGCASSGIPACPNWTRPLSEAQATVLCKGGIEETASAVAGDFDGRCVTGWVDKAVCEIDGPALSGICPKGVARVNASKGILCFGEDTGFGESVPGKPGTRTNCSQVCAESDGECVGIEVNSTNVAPELDRTKYDCITDHGEQTDGIVCWCRPYPNSSY